MATPDELLAALTGTLSQASVGSTPPSQAVPGQHPRFSQHKRLGCSPLECQEERRRNHLKHMKKRREEYHNWARDLADANLDDSEADDDASTTGDLDDTSMDTSTETRKYRPKKLKRSYKNQLMFSEWLVEISDDFASKWTMVPVPSGQRSFVIVSHNVGYQYSKGGRLMASFDTLIPSSGNGVTLLDAIYLPGQQRFVVLDIMMWNGNVYYECDTDFRFFWAKTKLEEEGKKVSERSDANPYPFNVLDNFKCDLDSISEALNSPLMFGGGDGNLDGLLFYHRDVHYLPQTTPLVGWLKGYMVPEMFGVEVSEEVMKDLPMDYQGKGKFMADFDKELKAKNDLWEKEEEAKKRRKEERKRIWEEKRDKKNTSDVTVEDMKEESAQMNE